MKNIAVLMLVFGFCGQASAQTALTDNYWKTGEECIAAVNAASYYPTIIKKKKLGADEVVQGHPTGGCFEMNLPESAGGRGFVRIDAGRKFVYSKKTGKLLRLEECDNDVQSFVPFPQPKIPEGPRGKDGNTGADGAKGDTGDKGDKGDKGDDGKTGADGKPGEAGKSVTAETPTGKESLLWGPTANTLLASFSSSPVNAIVGRLARRDVCDVKGQAFDVGMALRDEPRSSFWRFTIAGKLIEDGSYTHFLCENCGTEVTTRSQSMRVWGVRAERVFRFTDWRIQPMAAAHAGVGFVTGRARRFEGPVGRSPTLVEEVGARELFGSAWFPLAGFGVGLIGDFGPHVTLGLTVAGIEYPGIYYGGLQLTIWPK